MSYVIAVPTHRRSKIFAEKTLAFLRRSDVSLSKLHVFFSDDADRAAYELPEEVNAVVCPTSRSATDKFNEIHRHFAPGTKVFVLEDDIELIRCVTPKTNDKEPLTALDGFILAGFNALPAEGGLWGITPHDNTFFMSGETTSSLKLIVAHAFGFVSTQNPALEVTQPSKTDYERTLRYFVEYGKVWRLDSVGVRTKSYTQAGGIQSDYTKEQRAEAERAACDYIVKTWPHLAAHKEKKTSDFAELRLKPCKMSRDELRAWERKLGKR